MAKERFLAYIKFEKRYSFHTVTAYRTDLDQFFGYLLQQYQTENIHDIDHLMIRSWLVNLVERKVSNRSINRKLTVLKSFYRFLIREGVADHNPVRKVHPPKPAKRLPVYVDKEKMDQLLDGTGFREGFTGMRDRLVLELLYATGMRLSELINLGISDIDFHNQTIKVLGKRNKERLIPFSGRLGTILTNYIHQRINLFGEGEQLLLTDKGTPVYPKMIYLMVHHYLGTVTTINKRSPHVMRHTFATHMLNNGAELNAVKELLGHSSLAATQVYTHNTIEKLKQVYKQAHPKA